MPNLTGRPEVFHIASGDVDTSQQIPLGTRASDTSGNEYIYLRGTASVATGDWCYIFYDSFTVARSGADVVGPIGIAGTAITAAQFGWFQIYGRSAIANIVTGAGQAVGSGPLPLYLTSTAGRAGTADVAGDLIEGAFILGGIAAANTGTAFVTYPATYNVAQD